ncbi:hypothetical protein BJX64DRAFT_275341 [Aspergillus heterothallicus]
MHLDPPFRQDTFTSVQNYSQYNRVKALLPASYRDNNEILIYPDTDLTNVLQRELNVDRLNQVQKYLWLAGRPMPPRPLHYQVSISRDIVIDERMDLHLVWEMPGRIYLKPIPRYLLDYEFWKHLCRSVNMSMKSRDESEERQVELHKLGVGFLFSYAALIQYESDFQLACEHHLLPPDITWLEWVEFIHELLTKINYEEINPRYLFGELRLSRLNKIYALRLGYVLRGYKFSYHTYGQLFSDYLAPITAATIYVALVLTAMQVGLATDSLNGNQAFQNVSKGFTVFAILAPIVLLALVFVLGLLHFVSNLFKTLSFKRKRLAQVSRRANGSLG